MTSLRSIGEKLRGARLERGISLEDIAASTRINVRFLSDIEEGKEPAVPPTYVRAFIKAFAERVDVDVDELLQNSVPDGEEAHASEPSSSTAHLQEAMKPVSRRSGLPVQMSGKSSAQRQLRPLLMLIVILLAGLIIIVLLLRSGRDGHSVEEVSFSEVVRQQEAKQLSSTASPDSSLRGEGLAEKTGIPDSLDLQVVASESLWVQLVIDDGMPSEYMLTKFSHLHRKAGSAFRISVGNAAAASLILNGKKISVEGKENQPVKNIVLTRETLQSLRGTAVQKEAE